MNKLMFKLVFLVFFSVPSWAFADSANDEEFCAQLNDAKTEMEDTLLRIKQRKQNDSAFLKALNNSQKQWMRNYSCSFPRSSSSTMVLFCRCANA
jgi:hypothetical protein